MRKGLYVSPTEFRSFAAVDKTTSLSQEIATRQRSIDFYSLGMSLPNPDPVLKKMGKDISIYKELRSDAVVRGCIAARKARTKTLLWEIDRGKSKSRQAKFIEDAIKALPVRQIIGKLLDAPLYGYQPFEVMWDVATWTPTDVVAKPQKWFAYNENNEPRFLTKESMINGIELPAKKFIFATNDGDYENPYGDPVLSSCFWPVTFRKGGYKFWVTFTEKFGMPFIVGKHPRGAGQDEIDRIADMLEKMVQDAIAVIPDDGSVEIPDTKVTGSADLYDRLIKSCTGEINTAILGHSAGAQSTPGKLGGEDTAEGTGENIGGDDQHIVEDFFNTLIDWICEYNFAERAERPRFIMYEEEDVDATLAERDDKLTTSLEKSNLRLSKKYYQKGYALEDEDIEDAPAPEPPMDQNIPPLPPLAKGGMMQTQFAKGPEPKTIAQRIGDIFASFFSSSKPASSEDPIDTAIAAMKPEDLQAQMEGVLKPVIELVNTGASYEVIMKDLTKAYPDMDTAGLEEMLSRAIFVAECRGRIEAAKKNA